jgi:aminoglycoside phosphotransferase (APT) family kinase protein
VQRLKSFFPSDRHVRPDIIDGKKVVDKQSTIPSLPAASSSPGSTPSPSPTSSNSSNDDVDEELWWGPVQAINHSKIRVLVLRLVGHLFGQQCFVSDVKQDTCNRVFFVKFLVTEIEVCVKVLAAGWPGRWSPQEAQRLRCEALTLRYMRQRLGHRFPSPNCVSYDTDMNNEIHAPYILMTILPGKPGYTVWDYLDPAIRYDEENREKRQRNMLRSLACHIAKMRVISFDAIGVVDFDNDSCDNPKVVLQQIPHVGVDGRPDPLQPHTTTWEEMPVVDSTRNCFEELLKKNPLTKEWFDQGRQVVLSQIPRQLPKSLNDYNCWTERFSLAHPELDLENILFDDEGNVTGIIDWDGVSIKLHFLGWCTIPMWIRKEYDFDFDAWPFNKAYNASPVKMHQWRRIHTKAMHEAIGLHKDISSEEEELLPPNYCHMSHLAHSFHNGLLTSGRDHDQLRSFCDHVTSVLFPAVQPLTVYRGLASIKKDEHVSIESDEDGSSTSLSHWIFRRLGNILRDGRPKEISRTPLRDKNSEAVPLVNNDDDADNERVHSSKSIEDCYQSLDTPGDRMDLISKTDLVCYDRPSTVRSASSVSRASSNHLSERSNQPNDVSSTSSAEADDGANDPANNLPVFTNFRQPPLEGGEHQQLVRTERYWNLIFAADLMTDNGDEPVMAA